MPPTPLQIHVGASAKFWAIGEVPVECRLSFQVKAVVHRPFVVDEVGVLEARPGLEHDDIDAVLAELVGKRPAAGARAMMTTTESSSWS